MQVRVGGRFIYPPPDLSFDDCQRIDRAVFVAGGVGINPIMSMLSAMHSLGPGKIGGMPKNVRVLYTVRKTAEEILFYERIERIAQSYSEIKDVDLRFVMFETGSTEKSHEVIKIEKIQHISRRITHEDLLDCLGLEGDRQNTVVYICGLPKMTDEFVDFAQEQPGMDEKRVLCEKWW